MFSTKISLFLLAASFLLRLWRVQCQPIMFPTPMPTPRPFPNFDPTIYPTPMPTPRPTPFLRSTSSTTSEPTRSVHVYETVVPTSNTGHGETAGETQKHSEQSDEEDSSESTTDEPHTRKYTTTVQTKPTQSVESAAGQQNDEANENMLATLHNKSAKHRRNVVLTATIIISVTFCIVGATIVTFIRYKGAVNKMRKEAAEVHHQRVDTDEENSKEGDGILCTTAVITEHDTTTTCEQELVQLKLND